MVVEVLRSHEDEGSRVLEFLESLFPLSKKDRHLILYEIFLELTRNDDWFQAFELLSSFEGNSAIMENETLLLYHFLASASKVLWKKGSY